MPRPRNTPGLPGNRGCEIVNHVARYRLSTPSVLYELFFRDDLCQENAVTQVTSRLVEQDYLRRHPLYQSYSYFTLGKRGAKAAGVKPKRVGGPFGSQACYCHLGMLHFCARRPAERERLTKSDIDAEVGGYPELRHRGLDNRSYFTEEHATHGKRLGLMWVDGGGPAEHIRRKIQQDLIAPRLVLPGLRERIEQDRFVLAIVTYLEDKQQQILAAVKSLRTQVLFRVEVVPELLPLLPRR